MVVVLCRDMKDKSQRLEPGCSALYTWQDPLGKRELIWKCPDKDKEFKDELIKVSLYKLMKFWQIYVNNSPLCDIFLTFKRQLK